MIFLGYNKLDKKQQFVALGFVEHVVKRCGHFHT